MNQGLFIQRQGYVTSNTRELFLYIYNIAKLRSTEYILGPAFLDIFFAAQPFSSYIWSYTKTAETVEYKMFVSYENSGKIIVTRWDKENMILSGTFYGKLKQIDGEEIIEIKDGRFDLNLKTLQP